MTSGTELVTSRVALRDRPFVDVLDLSFCFLRESFGPLLRLALIVLPLPIALTVAAGHLVDWWLGWTVAIALASFVSAPFTVLFSQFVFQQAPSVKAALTQSLAAMPRLLMVNIGLAIALGLAFLFLVLPVLWVASACFFVSEAVLLERARLGEAFSRSSRLGTRASGDVLMASIVLGLFYFVAPALGHQLGGIVLEHVFSISAPAALSVNGGSALAAFGFWLAVPYVALVRFLFYINVRTRTEGWDIQTAFATIAARTDEEADA